jgi:TolA-binding protein
MKNKNFIDKEPDTRQRLLEKWRLFSDAVAGIDDPHGEHLQGLEDRIRRLEGEVESLHKRLSTDTPAPVLSSDFPPAG